MIGAFINISLVFLFIRFFFVETWGKYGKSQILSYCMFFLYIVILIMMQMTYSQDVLKDRCDYPYKQMDQFKLFIYVLFPNLMIFMMMFIILKIFPGWKAPFSNTFGYFLAYTMGIKSTFSTLLKDPTQNEGNPAAMASVKQIMENKSLMINQFTVDNFANTFNEFVKNDLFFVDNKEKFLRSNEGTISGFKHSAERNAGLDQFEAIKKLFSAVTAKDLVSEHIWYILTGCLVITIVKNTMGELNCNLLNLGTSD